MKAVSYSEKFKQNAVRMYLTQGFSYPQLSEKLNVSRSSLHYWVQKYGKIQDMKQPDKKLSKSWSPEQKLEALLKTASMNEEELGQYLRSNGLHSSDIESFKKICLEGFSTKGRPKLDPEVVALRKENKALDKDLKRNQKALAEQSARIILLKKSHEIWGTPEEDE